MTRTIIALMLLTSSAAAIEMPPPQYDVPYTGKLTVTIVPVDEIEFWCKAAGLRNVPQFPPGQRLLGCAFPKGNRCSIYLPKVDLVVPQETHDRMRRHELGHCNGWRH